MRKWTMGEVLKVKTRTVIILSIILTIIMNKLVNQILTREVILEDGILRTYEFSLGMHGVVFMIPAAFISILIVKLYMNKTRIKSDSFEEEGNFNWYSIYGTVIGFIIFLILFKLSISYASQMSVTNVWEGFTHIGVVLFVPIVIAAIFAIVINHFMIRLTKTNGRLIQEIKSGQHDFEFKDDAVKSEVLNLLAKGRVSSVKGGIKYSNITNAVIGSGAGTFFVLFSILNKVTPTIEKSNWSGGFHNQSSLHNKRKKLKSQMNYETEQKRKQSEVSTRRYIKQAKYNSKYSQSEWNQAVRDEREYKKAKRDEDRL